MSTPEHADDRSQLRAAAAKIIGGDQLEAFIACADPQKLRGPDGALDTTRVAGAVHALFSDSRPTHQDFGQYRGAPPIPGRGDGGRDEARRRFGTPSVDTPPDPNARGAAGAAEATRRFGGKRRV
jgi:hypothetical protein